MYIVHADHAITHYLLCHLFSVSLSFLYQCNMPWVCMCMGMQCEMWWICWFHSFDFFPCLFFTYIYFFVVLFHFRNSLIVELGTIQIWVLVWFYCLFYMWFGMWTTSSAAYLLCLWVDYSNEKGKSVKQLLFMVMLQGFFPHQKDSKIFFA